MTKMSSVLLVAVFVPLYGWDVWEALGNLLGLPAFYEALGVGESIPWMLLWAGVVMPVAVFVSALLVSFRFTGAIERILVFVTGWAVAAALTVSFAEIEQAIRAAARLALLG